MRSLSHRASGSTQPQHRCGTSSAPDRRPEAAALEQEIRQCRRAVLVVNTRSRHGARAYSEAKRLLAEGGITLDAAYPVRNAERLQAIVREEIAKGRKFIILGGGDGTISSVVDHFAYASVVFGVLPLGTANSFARTLGIPLDLAGAIDVLVNGKVANIDLAKINEDYFANGSSIGMPAIVGRATPHSLKKWLGRGAYGLVAYLSRLAGRNLANADFTGAVMEESTFEGAKLDSASFFGADLRRANLVNAAFESNDADGFKREGDDEDDQDFCHITDPDSGLI